MANRVFVFAVIVLWLGSMSWLVVDRILPSFYDGQPPVAEGFETAKAVAWRVEWAGLPVGWAASVRLAGVAGTTDLHNRIVLKDIPLMDLAPTWMRAAVGQLGNMTFDARTRIEFDSLGNFSSFESRISVNDMPSVLKMSGRVEDSDLELNVQSGDLSYSTPVHLPNRTALNEVLFPDAQLSRMYVGRCWQEEIYSPFRSPNDPVELVRAEVVSQELIEYQGEIRQVLRVEFRGMAGVGVPQNAQLQAVAWVNPTGTVLQRDVLLGSSRLRFVRLSDEEAQRIGTDFFDSQLRLPRDHKAAAPATTVSLDGSLPRRSASKP